MNLNYKKILIFDFETTGLSPISDRVIEVGAILLEKNDLVYEVKERLDLLIKQEKPISDFITNLTGITNEMLAKDGVDEEIAFNMLNNLIDDETLLVAYNLAFDIGFLFNMYQRYISKNYAIKNDILDCMAVYKDRYEYPHKLLNAVERFNLVNENAHRASDDALATFKVLEKLAEAEDNLSLYVNVLGYNPKYREPDTFFFKQIIKKIPQGMRGLREIEKARK
ncbi:3'-5' exonuclease [Acholeplasma hippikon]|uniref:DNA polymerase III polC-type n=1 Tax=Acholeplasma hippikon TaxID=264636 RepID=A0A449BJF8_9MOLU|nr:3'-5' exonuclease [Acholeplasma hippikon]VEU82582.1 DNA polymerase III polC-type [Acholeplasma hippikon]